MQQDKHYRIAKSLILDGTIKTFSDIFKYAAKSTIAKDLNMHFNTIQSRIDHPGSLSIEELDKLAEMIGIDVMDVIKLAHVEYEDTKKTKRKK